MLKRLLAILLVLTLSLASCFVFVACDDDDKGQTDEDDDEKNDGDGDETGDTEKPETPAKVDYTVTVIDSDGIGVMGAKVQLFDKDKNLKLPAVETDIDGKATFNRKAGNYTVLLTHVPADYVEPDYTVEYSFTNNNVLIRVEQKSYPRYTIKVVDQHGNPVVGAEVQACTEIGCIPFGNLTDANGESWKEIVLDDYEAKINNLPDGYSERPGMVGQYYEFTGNAEDGFSVTISVVKN